MQNRLFLLPSLRRTPSQNFQLFTNAPLLRQVPYVHATPSVSVVLMPSRMRMQPLSFFKTRSSYGCTKPINSSICDSNFPSTTLSGNIRASGYFSFRLRIATPSPLSYFTPKTTSRNASLGRFIKSAHFYGLCFYHLQALLYATLFLYPTL